MKDHNIEQNEAENVAKRSPIPNDKMKAGPVTNATHPVVIRGIFTSHVVPTRNSRIKPSA